MPVKFEGSSTKRGESRQRGRSRNIFFLPPLVARFFPFPFPISLVFFLKNSHHQGQVRFSTRLRARPSNRERSMKMKSKLVLLSSISLRFGSLSIDDELDDRFPGPSSSSISSASYDGSASTTLQLCRGPSSGQVGLRWFRLGGGRFLLRLQEYQGCRLRLQVALLRLDYQELDLVAIAPRERLRDQSCYLLMMETCRGETHRIDRISNFNFIPRWIDAR